MPLSHLSPRRAAGAVAWLLVGLLGCQETKPTDTTGPELLAAKGGGGGPGPKVKQAVPNEAPQGTTLVVRVIGSGFDDGSTVEFTLAGDSTLDMVVDIGLSTFIDEQNLDVHLTIALDAEVESYDIEVTTSRGKKGIGSEKFSVKLKGGPPQDSVVSVTFRGAFGGASGDGVLSDNGDSYDGVILELGNLKLDVRASVSTRKLCLDFGGQDDAPRNNLFCDDGWLTTSRADDRPGGFLEMTVGDSMTTVVQVTWVIDGFNWFLRFGMDCMDDDAGARGDVNRISANTWTLEGTNATLCKMPVKGRPLVTQVGDGVFSMPFKLTIVQ